MGLWTRKPIESAHEGSGPRLRRSLGPPIRFFVWIAPGLLIHAAMHLWRGHGRAPA
jgi:hypothetical protein